MIDYIIFSFRIRLGWMLYSVGLRLMLL